MKVVFIRFLSSIVIEGMSSLFIIFLKCILKQLKRIKRIKKKLKDYFLKKTESNYPFKSALIFFTFKDLTSF